MLEGTSNHLFPDGCKVDSWCKHPIFCVEPSGTKGSSVNIFLNHGLFFFNKINLSSKTIPCFDHLWDKWMKPFPNPQKRTLGGWVGLFGFSIGLNRGNAQQFQPPNRPGRFQEVAERIGVDFPRCWPGFLVETHNHCTNMVGIHDHVLSTCMGPQSYGIKGVLILPYLHWVVDFHKKLCIHSL